MIAYDGNVLVQSFCQFAEPGLLLLARQTDQALECFLPFLAFVFGPLVDSLLFAFCSRCLRSCSRRTASSWRRASVSASRAFFSLSLMIAAITSSRMARGMRSRSAL